MVAQTPNFDFDLPTVGADSDAWGGFLNGNWSDLDTLLLNFLQLTGGTMTGQIVLPGAGTGLEAATVNDVDAVQANVVTVQGNLDTHEADVANPHVVTAAQVSALALSGGTMTGQIVLPGGGSGLEAATVGELITELNLKADILDPVFIGVVTTVDLFITGVVTLKILALPSSANIALSMDDASKKTIELSDDTTITVSGEVADQTVEVWITQTGGGGTATWVGVDKWIGGDEPVLSTGNGDIDIIVLTSESDGVTVIGQHVGAAS